MEGRDQQRNGSRVLRAAGTDAGRQRGDRSRRRFAARRGEARARELRHAPCDLMTHAGPSLEEIKRAAQARVHDVLAALGIAYRPRGNYISMCNPVEKDRHPSFTIWVKGP